LVAFNRCALAVIGELIVDSYAPTTFLPYATVD